MEINNFLALILIILAMVTGISGMHLYRIKLSTGTKTLAVLCFVIALYCLGFALELVSFNITMKLIFDHIKYLAVPVFAPIWLLFMLRLFDKRIAAKPWFIITLFAIPAINVMMRVINEVHSSNYVEAVINETSAIRGLSFVSGPRFSVYAVSNAVIFIVMLCVVVAEVIRGNKNRRNAFIMLGLVLALIIVSVFIMLGITENAEIILPFILPVAVILIYIEIFEMNLFHIAPLSHSKVFEWSENGIMVLDNELRLTDYNAAVKRIFPDVQQAKFGAKLDAFTEDADGIERAVMKTNEYHIKVSQDDEAAHYSVTSAALFDKQKKRTGYVVTFTNITKMVDAMDELSHLAATDSLTGTLTRRSFMQKAERAVARAKKNGLPLAFIMLDLDHFKRTNDTYGHIAGDEMLKCIADICGHNLRQEDSLGRFGGEEFVILLPDANLGRAAAVAERIRAAVQAYRLQSESRWINITVSLGVAGAERVEGQAVEEFIQHADSALYTAKKQGRNKVVMFDEG